MNKVLSTILSLPRLFLVRLTTQSFDDFFAWISFLIGAILGCIFGWLAGNLGPAIGFVLMLIAGILIREYVYV